VLACGFAARDLPAYSQKVALDLLDEAVALVSSMGTDAIDLTLAAKVTNLGPLVRVDGAILNVNTGALVNVAGGSFLKVTGVLIDLRNGGIVNVLNGALVSVTGGSNLAVSGALLALNGSTANNQVSVTNNLCSPACIPVSGIPVALLNGAQLSNVKIGANPVTNSFLSPGGVPIKVSSALNTAVIVVDGPTSKVSIAFP